MKENKYRRKARISAIGTYTETQCGRSHRIFFKS